MRQSEWDKLPILAQRIRILLERDGISANQLGEKTGIKPSVMRDYLNKRVDIGVNNLIKLADAFNVSTDYLLGRTEYQTIKASKKAAMITTGLSEPAIKKLYRLRSKPSGGTDDRIFSLVSDLIEAKEFEKIFSAIAEFIRYGITPFGDTFVTYEDPSEDEIKSVKRYLRDSGREIVTNDVASEAALKIASDTFQDVFRAVLKEEKVKNDSNAGGKTNGKKK